MDARMTDHRAYDSVGFSAYQVAEHHSGSRSAWEQSHERVCLAAGRANARATASGPLVYELPIYHPIRLSSRICMLDQLTAGGLEIRLGAATRERG